MEKALESLHHMSVTPGLVTLNSGCKRRLVPMETTSMLNERVTLPRKPALASVHLATTVYVVDGFSLNEITLPIGKLFSPS